MLQIALLAASDAQLLILDEPTSHLDLYAQTALEKAIADYEGTVLMVTHDFYLAAGCADYILLVEDHTVRRMRTRKFRKMVYDKYFDSAYLETDRKKQELEAAITTAFKKNDLAAVDKSTVQSKFASGESGIALQQIRQIQNCIVANEGDANYKVTGLNSPVMNEGDEPQMSHYTNTFDGGYATSISTQCENIGAAARFLDYAYTEEGSLFETYGEEGFSWDYVDGVPTFKEIITNNPETPDSQAARYFVSNYQNWSIRVIDAMSHLQPETLEIQKTFFAHMEDYAYPTVTYTDEEVDTIAEWNDIDTTCRERILNFILGNEDLSNWDSFISEIEGMGIQDVLAVRQAAYDRYKAR